MRPLLLLAACLGLGLTTSALAQAPQPVNARAISAERPPELLSSYNFFVDLRGQRPNARVTGYELNTALYSDGALKYRFVYVPPGAQARYNADGVFDFPVGTVLIKTFAMAADMRRPTENVRLIETRLLIRRESGWVALPYIWNEEQTDARYSPIGGDIPISFTNEEGQAIALEWAVPNRNQCLGCHAVDNAMVPIGPSARNLNRDGQLAQWRDAGFLDQAPGAAPRVPNAYNATDGSVEARARAYLDVNCAHCHNPRGPAHTSGLDLSWWQTDPALWGVNKRPVAAGRASAGFAFAIEPGHPERSILAHRMESTDPGVMMPELGRQLVDERAIVLMRDWISTMGPDGRPR